MYYFYLLSKIKNAKFTIMTQNKAHLLKKIIIASQDEQLADIDKNILRTVGYKTNVQVFTSGIDLALHLVDIDLTQLERDTIVFCHRNLQDMTAEELIDLIRLHPLAVHQPVVAIASNKSDHVAFDQKPFTKVIERPLSVQTLDEACAYAYKFEAIKRKQLASIVHTEDFQMSSGDFFKKLGEIQTQVNQANPDGELDRLSPAQALYVGYDLLRDKKVNTAIPVLLKALSDENVMPQASLALAKAYAANRKPDLVKKYLLEAIHGYANTNNDSKMLDLMRKYKARFPNLDNPLIVDAQRYVREKRISDLMFKLQMVNEFYPIGDESGVLAKVCLDNEDPLDVARQIQDALGGEFSWMSEIIMNSVQKGVSSKYDQNYKPPSKIQLDNAPRGVKPKQSEQKPAPAKVESFLNPPSEAQTRTSQISQKQKERTDSMLHQIAFGGANKPAAKPAAKPQEAQKKP